MKMKIVNNFKDIKKIRGIARHGEANDFSGIIGFDENDDSVVLSLYDNEGTLDKEWVLFLVDRELRELAKAYGRVLLSANISLTKVENNSLDKNKVIENIGKVEEDVVDINKDIDNINFEEFDDLYIYLFIVEKDFRESLYIPLSGLCDLETYLLYALHFHIKFPEAYPSERTILDTEVFLNPITGKEMVGFFCAYEDLYTHGNKYALFDREDKDIYLNKFFPIFKRDIYDIVTEVSESLDLDSIKATIVECEIIYPKKEDDLFGFKVSISVSDGGDNPNIIEKILFIELSCESLSSIYSNINDELYLAFLKYIKEK